jgi:LuxR family maltose regulon positive regulatory protein
VYVRQRLLQALQAAPGRPAIFVSAPAGYGKTTLLASYLENTNLPSMWYQIDASDTDPAAFFYYLGLAARWAAPRRRKPMPFLTADHLPSIRAFARTFFADLFSRLGQPGCLVLDDYHLLPPESPLHGLIGETLAILPKGTQVSIASRQPPPPIFAGLIANRRLHCLDWQVLKLTERECRGVLRVQGRAAPTPALLQQLMDTTDGWVAGVILLLQGGKLDQLEQVMARQESLSVMFDYFANEVFQRLDNETQEFLLKTSLLSQITVHASQRLTDSQRAAQILSRLAGHNCFTYRHRGRQGCYEYHALFRTFLLARAHETFPPDQLRTLLIFLCRLEHRNGHIRQAWDHVRHIASGCRLQPHVFHVEDSVKAPRSYDRMLGQKTRRTPCTSG